MQKIEPFQVHVFLKSTRQGGNSRKEDSKALDRTSKGVCISEREDSEEQKAEINRYNEMQLRYNLEDSIKMIQAGRVHTGRRAEISMNGVKIKMTIDSGSPVSTIDQKSLQLLPFKPKLQSCRGRYSGYGNEIIETAGEFFTNIA